MEQANLFTDLELRPTAAMVKGESRLFQCHWCGSILAAPGYVTGALAPGRAMPDARQLAACPVCNFTDWFELQHDSHHVAGPFHRVTKVYCSSCCSPVDEDGRGADREHPARTLEDSAEG